MNAEMIREGLNREQRFSKIQEMAQYQIPILNKVDFMKSVKKTSPEVYQIENKKKS